MQITSYLNDLYQREYNIKTYTENKAAVYGFLKALKVNKEHLNSKQLKLLLNSIKPIFKKLRKNHDQIKSKKKIKASKTLKGLFFDKLHSLILLFKILVYGNRPLDDLVKFTKKIAKDKKIKGFHVDDRRIERFKSVVKTVQKAISKGICEKDAMRLDNEYWLETVGIKLVVDKTKYEGRVYMGHFAKSKLLDKWSTGKDESGRPYQTRYTFEKYLNDILIPSLNEKELADFKSKCSIVDYYTPKVLATLEVHFDDEGNVYTHTPLLNAWAVKMKPNAEVEEYYSDFCRDFKISVEEDEHSKYQLEDGNYMYLTDRAGRTYFQIKNRGRTNHTSLSKGEAVLAAGNLKVVNGKIVEVDVFSGHYKPMKHHLVNFLDSLQQKGVDLGLIRLTYVADYNVQPWVIKTIESKDMPQWFLEALPIV